MAKPILTKEAAIAERDEAINRAHEKYERRLLEIAKLSEPKPPKPSPLERPQKAWELRQSGLTLREVGEQLGVKGNRARQLVAKYERVLEFRRRNPDVEPGGPYLSVRACNCLRDLGLDETQPAAIAETGAARLSKIPNMGKVSLQEIAVWLREQGYELAD